MQRPDALKGRIIHGFTPTPGRCINPHETRLAEAAGIAVFIKSSGACTMLIKISEMCWLWMRLIQLLMGAFLS